MRIEAIQIELRQSARRGFIQWHILARTGGDEYHITQDVMPNDLVNMFERQWHRLGQEVLFNLRKQAGNKIPDCHALETRYDAVYADGMKWLDSLALDKTQKLEKGEGR